MPVQANPASVSIDWGEHEKPADQRRNWLTSWLVSADGEEGDFVYDGPGGTTTSHEVPPDAVGIRFRWAARTGDAENPFRQWVVSRKPYLFCDHPEVAVQAMEFCE